MPVSTRSSRSTSKSTSKVGSPAKQKKRASPIKTGSKNGSPLKRGDIRIEDSVMNIPSTIVTLLEKLQVPTMEQMKKASREDLLQRGLAACNGIEADIVKAWLRCLHARAQDPGTKYVGWHDWLESKVTAREVGGSKSKSGSSDLQEAARIIITRRELVKQRQTLKKRAPPGSKRISFSDLKVAKARLTQVPTGRALKDRVKPEVLSRALSKLKRTGSDLA